MVETVAKKYGLDPVLVCALIEQESEWDTYAVRPEPAFKVKYVDPQNLSVLEAWTRSMSWGLMQTMGQTAREHGFTGPFLSQLCDAPTGLDMGCNILRSKIAAAGGDINGGLERYNGGANPNYAAQVVIRMAAYMDPTASGNSGVGGT